MLTANPAGPQPLRHGGCRYAASSRILVAGIGNIFLGDDGFGPEVIRRVFERGADPAVEIVDYGIRGMHLAYDLLDGCKALVLVDALPSRGAPGTLCVFEADPQSLAAVRGVDAHSMDPASVFATLTALGGSPPYTVVVGCEVADIEEGIKLSEPVAAAVPDAVKTVEKVVSDLYARGSPREG